MRKRPAKFVHVLLLMRKLLKFFSLESFFQLRRGQKKILKIRRKKHIKVNM